RAAALPAGFARLAARSVRAALAAPGRGVAADQGAAGDGGATRVRLRRLDRPGPAAAARAAPLERAAGAADRLSAGAGHAARLGGDADAAEGRRPRAAHLRAGRL